MEQQIEYLVEIQKVDVLISEVMEKKDTVPKKIDDLNRIIQQGKEEIDRLKGKFEENEKERRSLQSKIELENDRIERIEGKLSVIKTNKEYQALCKELDNMKKEIGKCEDTILALMDEDETLKSDIKSKEDEYNATADELRKKISEYEDEISKFDDKIGKYERNKSEYSQKVDKSNIAKYERIRARRAGVAIVAAIREVCQGCFMNIPPQLFIRVRQSSELITCPNCNRILYWREG